MTLTINDLIQTSHNTAKEKGWWDHLRISVATKELSDWYNNKAY